MNTKCGASRIGHICIAKMIGALLHGPQTVAELSELSGLSEYTVRRYVTALRKERAVHIDSWEEDSAGRVTAAAYCLGDGTDAKRPKRPRSNAIRMRQYRERRRQAAMNNALAGALA
jgi:predicted ArsR family transcriptional regulator